MKQRDGRGGGGGFDGSDGQAEVEGGSRRSIFMVDRDGGGNSEDVSGDNGVAGMDPIQAFWKSRWETGPG